MAVPAPLYWRHQLLTFKLESTYGTDPVPTGGSNAILASSVKLTPMAGTDIQREFILPWLGADRTISGELHAMIEFEVEMVPSGTAGTAPAWGPLLRACACSETIVAGTSVTYARVSEAFESATFYFDLGNTLFKSNGVRGNAKFVVNAQGIVKLSFSFTGLWLAPADASIPTADFSAFKDPKVASSANTPTFTVNSVALALKSFELDFGNKVELALDIGDEHVNISDITDAITCDVRASALADFNPFALAEAKTLVPIELVHGTTAGSIATLSQPTCEIMRPDAPTEAQGYVRWPLRAAPIPAAGNDQWTLTLT